MRVSALTDDARLLRPAPEREDLGCYRTAGGYGDGLTGDDLLAAVDAAGLRGRGGGGFPVARKWEALCMADGPRDVVANGAEGEPASLKDRYLLCRRPHLVLDGLERCALMIGAERAWVYTADAVTTASVHAALRERPVAVPVVVHQAPHTYVSGEETAAVRAIDGDEALPTAKPPRPFERGVGGRPTLVQNVETLAHVPFIAAHGAKAFRAAGTDSTPGTLLVTLSAPGVAPLLCEVDAGTPLDRVLDAAGLGWTPAGFVMGGFAGGLLGPQAREVRLSYEDLLAAGSLLGCAAVIALGAPDCPVAVAGEILAYFAAETTRQCGSCVRGTQAMRDVVAQLCAGHASADAVEKLDRWGTTLRGRGACGLLDAAAHMAASLMREFPVLVHTHLGGGCAICAAEQSSPWREPAAGRFAVAIDIDLERKDAA
ncbi:MAG: NADH-quinone oxidoreductase subunit 1 [Conexibacter sp.]|nr:NADH-quinone oxidoreductase subunit 1 [Conexibacter sp.]